MVAPAALIQHNQHTEIRWVRVSLDLKQNIHVGISMLHASVPSVRSDLFQSYIHEHVDVCCSGSCWSVCLRKVYFPALHLYILSSAKLRHSRCSVDHDNAAAALQHSLGEVSAPDGLRPAVSAGCFSEEHHVPVLMPRRMPEQMLSERMRLALCSAGMPAYRHSAHWLVQSTSFNMCSAAVEGTHAVVESSEHRFSLPDQLHTWAETHQPEP